MFLSLVFAEKFLQRYVSKLNIYLGSRLWGMGFHRNHPCNYIGTQKGQNRCRDWDQYMRYSLVTNCPIKNHGKGFIVLQTDKIIWGEIELVFSDNKGKAARIEIPDFCVVFVKAICFKINIFQTFRNIHLATPYPSALPIDYIVFVLTFGQAVDGEGFIVQITIKVCVKCHNQQPRTWF